MAHMSPTLWQHGIAELRGVVMAASAALGVDQSIHIVAQSVPTLSDAYLMQIAEKGGGWVVLLIVLFFYRRDYQRLTTSEGERVKQLVEAIEKQSESEQRLAVALAENTTLVRQAILQSERHHRERDE